MDCDDLLKCRVQINPNVYYTGKEFNSISGEWEYVYERVKKGEWGYIDWEEDI